MCKCGVLQHARCFDSGPVLYISLKHLHQVCCANFQTLPPSWIALAYITLLHTHQSVHPVFTFAPLCFSWSSHSKGSGNGKGEVLVCKHTQTPAYLRCLAGIIIMFQCKHTHSGWSLCTCLTEVEELLPYRLQTKYVSQETVCGFTGINCTRALVGTCHWKTWGKNKKNLPFTQVCVETCF